MHLLHAPVFGIDVVTHVGHGGDDIHVELTVEALLHNLHVQQSEEAAAKAESEGNRRLRREGQRGIVELQFLQRRAQVFVVLRLNRINAGKHHRLHFLKALDGFLAGARHMGDGIAHAHLR